MKSQISGAPALPFVGQTLALLKLLRKPIPSLTEHYNRYGTFSTLTKQGGALMAFAPEYNQQVLSNPNVFHSISTQGMKDSPFVRLSSGLVNMNGERHKQHRRLMMPAFHRQAVASYCADMVMFTDEMLNTWQIGQMVDVVAEMRRLVLRIISKALFGVEDLAKNERLGLLMQSWLQLGNNVTTYYLPHRWWRFGRISAHLENELLSLIEHKRKLGGHDVLSVLIQAHDEEGHRLTDGELIGHLAVLFIAGHETTINTLSWTLLLLALHSNILTDLQDEFRGVTPTMETLNNLEFLDQVIKESMRILPTAIFAIRNAVEPFEMGGYHFPPDTGVFLSHYITHRLPDLYPQPTCFLPQRWETIEPSPYEYMPFSAGSRMCIGATFASVEMRIVLSLLLQRFTLVLPENSKVDYATTANIMHPAHAVWMRVETSQYRPQHVNLQGNIRELLAL